MKFTVLSAHLNKGRRYLIGAVAYGLLTSRFAARAQTPSRSIRIGWLTTIPFLGTPLHALFTEAMRERGWIEGRHYLTVNVRTAKAIGVVIPHSLLLRADAVLE